MPRAIEDPILAYTAAEGEINQIQWGATQPDWIGGCCWLLGTNITSLRMGIEVTSILLVPSWNNLGALESEQEPWNIL
jgi:hypothetical protein